jgi:hypothetical protein
MVVVPALPTQAGSLFSGRSLCLVRVASSSTVDLMSALGRRICFLSEALSLPEEENVLLPGQNDL